jgi:hypothetical protein
MTAAPFMALLIAGLFFGFRVYIRFFGNGRQWFRSYSGSLGKTECRPTPSNQGLLPLTFGASPWLGLTRGVYRNSVRGDLPAGLVLMRTRSPVGAVECNEAAIF